MQFSDYFFMPLDEIRDEDLVDIDRCGCCGAKNAFRQLSLFREKPQIHFVKCRRCGAVTYDRMLRKEKLDEVYEKYNYLDNDEKDHTGDKITFYGKERFARHLMKMMKPLPEQNKIRILDFGGGDGSLSYAFGESIIQTGGYDSIEIVVVDYTDTPCVSREKNISLTHCFPLSALPKDELFDIVIASAVLEHLPSPGREFRQVVELTAPGGYLYFRSPYKYPLYCLMKRFGITLDMRYPRHIWDFSSYWWHRIVVCLHLEDQLTVVKDGPSITEKTVKDHFLMAIGANLLKAPGRVTRRWHYVGGWEILYRKTADKK